MASFSGGRVSARDCSMIVSSGTSSKGSSPGVVDEEKCRSLVETFGALRRKFTVPLT